MRLRNCLGMIWSVSTSARSSTLTAPFTTFTGSTSVASAGRSDPRPDVRRGHPALVPRPDVHEPALDGGCGCHLGRHEVGPPAAALTALEVAVRRRGAALAR